jgi:undecaprenyl-diphosphatase
MIRDWLWHLDARVSRRVRTVLDRTRIVPVLTFVAHSGDSAVVFPVLGLLWWQSGLSVSSVFSLGIAAALLSMLCVALAKLVFRRARPAGDWGTLCRKADPHSFPSGHAARTMALAFTVVSAGWPGWGLLLVAWSLFVGVARVGLGIHWSLDVAAGWVFGIAAGIIVAVL